ncbi:hypothetical protein C8Q75DRAFT_849873 [Abortiporus biennis]|nr:hypothetical protein C8Q75DRAFT_849873 [Abortiporus biennis]
MATFSDGGDDLVGTNSLNPPGDMRFYLQSILDAKEKQLQQAGTLGQQLLAQRMELEERIRQLQELDLDAVEDIESDAGIRDKYRELAETIKSWDVENEQLSTTFTTKTINGTHASPPSHSLELSRGDFERVLERSKVGATGTAAAQNSRRAKNAAHRADDVEFAFEIGSGLLTEVRRLQSLLGERDKAIQDMKEEKDDMEKTIEGLRTALRQQEQSADKYKEENWNLEVTLQELRTQLSDSQATTQRLEGEQKRLTRVLTATRESVDQHKNEAEKHQTAYEELKAKHETDIAQARKHAASLQRDKSDLQQTLDSLKLEMSRASKRLPRFGSPLTPNGGSISEAATPMEADEDDVFSAAASTNRKRVDTSALFPADDEFGDLSPEPSPSKPFLAPNHPTNEIEALQQRLAHAQRQINTLKGTLQREKEMRIEYKRKLDASPGINIEDEDEQDFEDEDTEETRPRVRVTPYRSGGRGRGRGRGRGGLTLMQRFNMAAQSPSSEYADDDDLAEARESSPAPPVPPIPLKFQDEENLVDRDSYPGEEEDTEVQQSPSPQMISNRTSVDGMDPMFANILRRSASANSLPFNASPLRQSVIARTSRGGTFPRRHRGGAAFQEARPPSLVGQPEALAAELLGLGMGSSMENTLELPEVETEEFGCQTEPEEPPVVVVPPPPSVSDMGVQVDPEPIPVILTAEISMQTDPEPIAPYSEIGIQHEDLTPLPVFVSTGMATDPEPEPEPQPVIVPPPKPVLAQAETQTDAPSSVDQVTQTVEPVVILPSTAEVEIQTAPVFVSHEEIEPSALLDISGGSGDATITPRPPPLNIYESDYEDDGTQTETGSIMETDTDQYQDARESINLTTPTESFNDEDYHSIMTVTDNDFSDSDDESIKVSRIDSRVSVSRSAMSSAVSIPIMSATPAPELPVPTYESKGVSAEILVEQPPPPKVEAPPPTPPIPEVPKPELKEISVQTDAWTPPIPPPAAVPITAPSTPAHSPSPLFRVGPSSQQQFQFISPPPSAGPTTVNLPNVVAPSPNTTIRDSNATFIARPRTSHSDRRQSIESTLSSAMDDLVARSRTPSNVVDKSRPPMMMLPPPPRQPPPPNSMPPPQFIPDRRILTSSNASRDIPPPRPSSPPPPELIQRATTPTFGAVLSVPGGRPFGLRQHGSSLPPQAGLRQPPSTSSFRSAANAASRAQASPLQPSFTLKGERREMSTTSLNSNGHSLGSQRSSISSDNHAYDEPSHRLPQAPVTPERNSVAPARAGPSSTDPTVIHAITQTMIGEFLYKYTRRTIGKGHGERRHKRFFWVHPYTRTLYWSSADPGSSGVSESSAKSAYIEEVRQVLDPNPMPPGIHQYSVIVSTPQREMKFTAPTKERHDIWFNALQFLLSRPAPVPGASPGNGAVMPNSPMSEEAQLPDADNYHNATVFASPQSQRSTRTTRTELSADNWNVTPRGQRSRSQISLGGSMSKRSGTPAAEYLRWSERDGPQSPTKSFEHIPGGDDELDFELHDETLSDEGYEGLENVRACCDGRHTVGRSGRIEHHHHHDHNPREPLRTRDQHLDPNPLEITRPVSPAWSFRSRAGSATSHDGAGFFSRFGSRRSTKTVPIPTAAAAHER